MRRQVDNSVLEMALLGYNAKLNEVIEKMAEIERQLGVRHVSRTASRETATAPASKQKRKLSAAGKQAIRAALKKRWAAYHAKTSTAKPATKTAKRAKRTLSSAAKARLAANLAKARAAKAKKRAAGSA